MYKIWYNCVRKKINYDIIIERCSYRAYIYLLHFSQILVIFCAYSYFNQIQTDPIRTCRRISMIWFVTSGFKIWFRFANNYISWLHKYWIIIIMCYQLLSFFCLKPKFFWCIIIYISSRGNILDNIYLIWLMEFCKLTLGIFHDNIINPGDFVIITYHSHISCLEMYIISQLWWRFFLKLMVYYQLLFCRSK